MRALLALVALAGGGLFGYDASAPLGWRDVGATDTRDGITARDVSFNAPKLGRVPGYLVLPPGDGPFPAIVWMPGSRGTREDLVEDARDLAKRGVAGGLLPQPAEPVLSCPRAGRERETYVRNVVLVRRSVDALAALPQIDAARIGAAGFSYGAYYAAVHQLNEPAYADRAAFLVKQLGVERRSVASIDDPCIGKGETPVQLTASDGARVYGVEVGTGTTGVVLGHQSARRWVALRRSRPRRGWRRPSPAS